MIKNSVVPASVMDAVFFIFRFLMCMQKTNKFMTSLCASQINDDSNDQSQPKSVASQKNNNQTCSLPLCIFLNFHSCHLHGQNCQYPKKHSHNVSKQKLNETLNLMSSQSVFGLCQTFSNKILHLMKLMRFSLRRGGECLPWLFISLQQQNKLSINH